MSKPCYGFPGARQPACVSSIKKHVRGRALRERAPACAARASHASGGGAFGVGIVPPLRDAEGGDGGGEGGTAGRQPAIQERGPAPRPAWAAPAGVLAAPRARGARSLSRSILSLRLAPPAGLCAGGISPPCPRGPARPWGACVLMAAGACATPRRLRPGARGLRSRADRTARSTPGARATRSHPLKTTNPFPLERGFMTMEVDSV